MNQKQIANLFAGATKEQYELFDRKQKCEQEFMQYVYANRDKSNLHIEKKYKEIKKKYKLI